MTIPESRQMTDDPLGQKRFEVEGGCFSDSPLSVSGERPEKERTGFEVWDTVYSTRYRGRIYPTREKAEAVLASVVWHSRSRYSVREVRV